MTVIRYSFEKIHFLCDRGHGSQFCAAFSGKTGSDSLSQVTFCFQHQCSSNDAGLSSAGYRRRPSHVFSGWEPPNKTLDHTWWKCHLTEWNFLFFCGWVISHLVAFFMGTARRFRRILTHHLLTLLSMEYDWRSSHSCIVWFHYWRTGYLHHKHTSLLPIHCVISMRWICITQEEYKTLV